MGHLPPSRGGGGVHRGRECRRCLVATCQVELRTLATLTRRGERLRHDAARRLHLARPRERTQCCARHRRVRNDTRSCAALVQLGGGTPRAVSLTRLERRGPMSYAEHRRWCGAQQLTDARAPAGGVTMCAQQRQHGRRRDFRLGVAHVGAPLKELVQLQHGSPRAFVGRRNQRKLDRARLHRIGSGD